MHLPVPVSRIQKIMNQQKNKYNTTVVQLCHMVKEILTI